MYTSRLTPMPRALPMVLAAGMLAFGQLAQASTLISCAQSQSDCDPLVMVGSPTVMVGGSINVFPGPTVMFSMLNLTPTLGTDGLYSYGFSIPGDNAASISAAYFPDSQLQNFTMPDGWTVQMDPAQDRFGLGHGAGTLIWRGPSTTLNPTFAFQSIYEPTFLQFSALLSDGSGLSGPIYMPLSPSAISAGQLAAVPEPASSVFVLVGLCAIGAARMKRRRQEVHAVGLIGPHRSLSAF
jgi:hypothetical protein